jgi:hypothetical protein
MKGLLSIFGLVIALLVLPVQADLLDTAPWQPPKTDSVETINCVANVTSYYLNVQLGRMDFGSCLNAVGAYADSHNIGSWDTLSSGSCYSATDYATSSSSTIYCKFSSSHEGQLGEVIKEVGRWNTKSFIEARVCPPDNFPTFTYDYDSDGDGKIDRCYNPDLLNDLSGCDGEPDWLGNNTGQLAGASVCIKSVKGGLCSYKVSETGFTLTKAGGECFNQTPEFDPLETDMDKDTPDNTCQTQNNFGSTLTICKVDKDSVCNNNICPDDCGSVNGVFVCFSSDGTQPDKPENGNGNTDPDNPDPVNPTDPNNPLSVDISKVSDRLGQLISLTRDKGNDITYALDKNTGKLITSVDGGFKDVVAKLNDVLNAPGVQASGGGGSCTGDGCVPGGDEGEGEAPAPDAQDWTWANDDFQTIDTTEIDEKIDKAREDLLDYFKEVKALFADKFNFDGGGGGGLPSLGVIEYNGNATDVTMAPYANDLSWIGAALVLICTIAGLFIIFR